MGKVKSKMKVLKNISTNYQENDSDWKSRVGWGLARQVGHPARLNLPTPTLHLQGRSHPATPSEAQPLDQHSVRDTSTESGSAAPLENSPWRRAYKAVPPIGAHLRPQPQT